MNFMVSSYNVQGLHKNIMKIGKLYEYYKNFDLCTFQEMHFSNKRDAAYFTQVFSKQFRIYSSFNSEEIHGGIAICFNLKSFFAPKRKIFEIPGRALGIQCSFESKLILIIAVYVPAKNEQRPTFIDHLFEVISGNFVYSDEVILLGDFNFVEDQNLDRSDKVTYVEAGFKEFSRIKNYMNLSDSFRFNNPNMKKFSFYSKSHKTKSRLDRLYCTTGLNESIVKQEFYDIGMLSDHLAFNTQFKLSLLNLKFGRSYWKFDSNIFKNDILSRSIENFTYDEIVYLDGCEDVIFMREWDIFKENVKCFIKEIKAAENSRIYNEKISLTKETEFFSKILKDYPDDTYLKERFFQSKEKLKSLAFSEIESRVRKTHYSELLSDRFTIASSKLLQKKSAENRIIYKLLNSKNELIEDADLILLEAKLLYERLFKAEKVDESSQEEFFLETPFSVANDIHRENLSADFSVDEILRAILGFKKNKSPGLDGLTAEFYIKFKDLLAPRLQRLFSLSFRNKKLPASMYSGVISLLYKGEKDKHDLSNWRPLTMLNIDYKILTKVLVNRLKDVLPTIVHKDQTCAVKGRDIRDGIALIYNVLHYAYQENLNGILLSVDHMRAFDIIEWDFILKTLQYFKLGDNFVNWVSIIGIQIRSCEICGTDKR